MTQIIVSGIVVLCLSCFLLFISIMHFNCKGFLMNNSYIYASKEKRKSMDKAPHYRQSAIVFLLLSIMFGSMGVWMLTNIKIFIILTWIALCMTIIYAVVSTIKLEKHDS